MTTEKNPNWSENGGIWQYQTRSMTILVHHHIEENPEKWFLTCHAVGIIRRPLSSKDAKEACSEALERIARYLKSLRKELPEKLP